MSLAKSRTILEKELSKFMALSDEIQTMYNKVLTKNNKNASTTLRKLLMNISKLTKDSRKTLIDFKNAIPKKQVKVPPGGWKKHFEKKSK